MAAQVRMVAGLFLLVALLVPLQAGIAFVSELAEGGVELPDAEATDGGYESTLQASILAMGSAELTAWGQNVLTDRFGVAPGDAALIPVWAEDGTSTPPLSELCIVLSGAALLTDPHPIEAYFSDVLACPCRVSVTLSDRAID